MNPPVRKTPSIAIDIHAHMMHPDVYAAAGVFTMIMFSVQETKLATRMRAPRAPASS